jgi:antitoxin ParD1/3/4
MPRVTISLPEHLQAFVEKEVAARGYATVGEYLALLVQKAHLERHRERVESVLLEGQNSGRATPLSRQDWQAIGRAGQERLAKEKKDAGKSNKYPRAALGE